MRFLDMSSCNLPNMRVIGVSKGMLYAAVCMCSESVACI